MTRNEMKKRLTKIEGVALKPLIPPRTQTRKEPSKIEYVPEYTSEYNDFFEFDDDLSKMESARRQVERIEEERILYETRMRALGNNSENTSEDSVMIITEDEGTDEGFVIEESIEEEPIKDIQIQEDIKVKICLYKKTNGDQCKKLALQTSEYCSIHNKMVNE